MKKFLIIDVSLWDTGRKSMSVAICNKGSSGECIFGKENCWFQHSEMDKANGNGIENNENEDDRNGNLYNNELIKQIFDMMEILPIK